MTSIKPLRSPLRIDVTSSSEDTSNPDDTSPISLTDSAIGDSTLSPKALESPEMLGSASVHDKSHCSSMSDDREVNFESYGENNDVEYDNDMVDFDDVDTHEKSESSVHRNPQNFVRRNAWMRTSLRRSPANNDQLVPPKRWGSFRHSKRVSSNAYASALYHQNGANSSGRSSNCDDGDMQSDVSLEDDVIDLNQKVQTLQDQVSQLAESQANTDDRYSKVRQENIVLNQRIHILEEQLREMDHRAGEQLADEQKRNRDLIARMEREKQLEIENYSIRFQTMERDLNTSMSEIHNLKTQNDRLKLEKNALEQELFETQQTLLQTQTEFSKLQDNSRRELGLVIEERKMNEHIVEELSKELESLKSASFPRGVLPSSLGVDFTNNSSPSSLMDEASGAGLNATTHINDLEDEIRALREKNKKLRESNNNLEAALINRSLQQGQEVLSKTKREGASIADELEMDDSQLRSALKEQQEVNAQLRGYIDGILMNIIDKYPELLEVRK